MLPEKKTSLYIGIGASAGGQDALCEFFTHLQPDMSAAYFVITHLGRYHKSRLYEIIGRHTAMAVIPVDQPMKVRPGTVYFLVENTVMSFDEAGVIVQRRIEWETVNRAIDTFFISLARQHGHQAVGVVLSGAGEDGVAGALELNKYDGTVLVQDPESSPFNGMPKATIAKDHPKAILTPAELARRVGQLVNLSAQK